MPVLSHLFVTCLYVQLANLGLLNTVYKPIFSLIRTPPWQPVEPTSRPRRLYPNIATGLAGRYYPFGGLSLLASPEVNDRSLP